MLSIRIKTMSGKDFEGDVSLRELNHLFRELVCANKEVTIKKWSSRKSELLDIDVFEKGQVPLYKSNQSLPDGV